MSASEAPRRGAPRSRWSISEKRRIVELSLSEGASVSEIALAHGLHHTSLSRWRSLYRSGELSGGSARKRACSSTASEKFFPVMITEEQERNAQSPRATTSMKTQMRESGTVSLSLPSGATLHFEIGTLDFAFIRALLVELRT